MSQRLKRPPTKSVLLQLKKQLVFLEQGHELLERKKELLTRVVYERLAVYRKLRQEAKTSLKTAYHWLSLTHLRSESASLRQLGRGLRPSLEIDIFPRSSVGVEYPAVAAKTLPLEPVGALSAEASFDETRRHLAEMVKLLAELAEAETALWRLLEEQRKTQKRVNALKYNIIPKYQATIRFIQATLEEEERNTLFQIKVLREQQTL